MNPNVANLLRGKTRQSVPDVAARRLGEDEAYLTVRDILSEASTVVPPRAGLSRERGGFYRCGFATLGLTPEEWLWIAPVVSDKFLDCLDQFLSATRG